MDVSVKITVGGTKGIDKGILWFLNKAHEDIIVSTMYKSPYKYMHYDNRSGQ